jgi:hypothetical protein
VVVDFVENRLRNVEIFSVLWMNWIRLARIWWLEMYVHGIMASLRLELV